MHTNEGGGTAQDDLLRAVGLRYDVAGRQVLGGVDLAVGRGESVAVSGPSGSGKSTLLMCVLGMLKPTAGAVHVGGLRMDALSRRKLLAHRRRSMGMVFQFGELLPELTPGENVALAAMLAGVPAGEAHSRAAGLLKDLGIDNDARRTGALSGGERQRTAVARALVNRPALVLADEPTGALDSVARHDVAELLFDIPERWGAALVVVTHDETVAARAKRRLVLEDGRLVAEVTA